jgi:hypothetical protein
MEMPQRAPGEAEQRRADRACDQYRVGAALADAGANRELSGKPRPRDGREQ